MRCVNKKAKDEFLENYTYSFLVSKKQDAFFFKLEILPFLPLSSLKMKLYSNWQCASHVRHMWLIEFSSVIVTKTQLYLTVETVKITHEKITPHLEIISDHTQINLMISGPTYMRKNSWKFNRFCPSNITCSEHDKWVSILMLKIICH